MEVITVVGRSHTDQQFVSEVFDLLYGGFKPIACHSLGEPGIDKKERFLVLITADEEIEFDFETQVDRLKNAEETYSVRLFNDLEEALEFAQTEYHLSEDKVQMHTEMEELIEQFPRITAEEAEQLSVMDALIRLGRVSPMPAKLYDERAIAIVSMSVGGGDVRITPLAILATEEILENLELPGEG